MGGVLILIRFIFRNTFMGRFIKYYILVFIFIVSSFGILGAYDDYKKLNLKIHQAFLSNLRLFLKFY